MNDLPGYSKQVLMKNSINYKECGKKSSWESVIVFLGSVFLSIFFSMESDLNPLSKRAPGTDSSVFQVIAMMIEKRKMPYKDTFDHKGPIIYLINVLGDFFSKDKGVWIIEIIMLSITIYGMYMISRLTIGKFESAVVTLACLSLLLRYFEGGNLTEEYALPFITISLYVFCDYLLNGEISHKRIIIAGSGFGVVLMLRPNMIAAWIVFTVFIFVELMRQKEIEKLIIMVGYFIIGTLFIVFPIIIWLIREGAFKEFWNCYVVYNCKYVNTGKKISNLCDSYMKIVHSGLFLFSLEGILLGIVLNCKYRIFNILYLFFLGLDTILVIMSGRTYMHYGMVMVPALIYPISLLLKGISELKTVKFARLLLRFSFFVVIFLYVVELRIPVKKIIEITNGKVKNGYSESLCEVIKCIEEETDLTEKISVYGNWDIVYKCTNREHATKYSYQFPIAELDKEIFEDYYNQLNKQLPKMIVIQEGRYDEYIEKFLLSKKYRLHWMGDCNDKNSASVWVLD